MAASGQAILDLHVRQPGKYLVSCSFTIPASAISLLPDPESGISRQLWIYLHLLELHRGRFSPRNPFCTQTCHFFCHDLVISMSLQVLTGIYYAYPVCLSAALLISHLILFRRHQHEPLIWKQPSRFGLIWYLQAALSLALVCTNNAPPQRRTSGTNFWSRRQVLLWSHCLQPITRITHFDFPCSKPSWLVSLLHIKSQILWLTISLSGFMHWHSVVLWGRFTPRPGWPIRTYKIKLPRLDCRDNFRDCFRCVSNSSSCGQHFSRRAIVFRPGCSWNFQTFYTNNYVSCLPHELYQFGRFRV